LSPLEFADWLEAVNNYMLDQETRQRMYELAGTKHHATPGPMRVGKETRTKYAADIRENLPNLVARKLTS
jgi:hypothetical protein